MGFWSDLFGCKDMVKKEVVVAKKEPPQIPKPKAKKEYIKDLYDNKKFILKDDDYIYLIQMEKLTDRFISILHRESSHRYIISKYNIRSLEKTDLSFVIHRSFNRHSNDEILSLNREDENYETISYILSLDKISVDDLIIQYKKKNEDFNDEVRFYFKDLIDEVLTKLKRCKFSKFGDYVIKFEVVYKSSSILGTRYRNYSTYHIINIIDETYEDSTIIYNDEIKDYFILNKDKYEIVELDYDPCEKYDYIINKAKAKVIEEINQYYDDYIDSLFEEYKKINNHLAEHNLDLLTEIKSVQDMFDFIKLRNKFTFTDMIKEKKFNQINLDNPLFTERLKFRLNQ